MPSEQEYQRHFEGVTLTAGTPHVVWLAPVSWDGIPGSDRALAMSLARYARILWVDPPVSAATTARHHGAAARRRMPSLSVIDARITRRSEERRVGEECSS